MSIPVLIQVYDDMRRLAIAGSAVAPGDFRLKKLVPPLEKSGEKAPVFAKVAQAAQAVVDSTEKTASAALLELATLVNAILYTQGETGLVGELKPLETTDLGTQSTQASARVLKPLLEALTTTGSGRIELVEDAIERGTFKDLRLVKPAVDAIDDPYPEIAELITRKVLPLYGKAILPALRAKLDLKGRGGHVQRLRLMHELDPAGARELVQQALADGSKEMRVAAIECLGTAGEDLAFLLEQSKAKAKDVRAAALRALSSADGSNADVIATLKRAIAGPDLELIADRVALSPLPAIQDYVLEQAESLLAALPKTTDKKEQGAAVTRLQQTISCLERRADPRAEAFLLKCFEQATALAAIKSEPSGADLNELVAYVLSRGTPTMKGRLVAAHASLGGKTLGPALYAARGTMPPAAFFETFRPWLAGYSEKKTKVSAAQERGAALVGVLTADDDEGNFHYRQWMHHGRYNADRGKATPLPPLDPRWLDMAVEAGAPDLVCTLARPGHAAANAFLSEQLAASKKTYEALEVLRTMTRVRHPGAADAVISALQKHAKESSHYHLGYWYGPMIAELPRSAVATLEALLPTLPDKMADGLLESIAALKDKPEEG